MLTFICLVFICVYVIYYFRLYLENIIHSAMKSPTIINAAEKNLWNRLMDPLCLNVYTT